MLEVWCIVPVVWLLSVLVEPLVKVPAGGVSPSPIVIDISAVVADTPTPAAAAIASAKKWRMRITDDMTFVEFIGLYFVFACAAKGVQ